MQKDGLVSTPVSQQEVTYLTKIIPLLQERVKFLSEISDLASYFFLDEITYSDPSLLVPAKMSAQETVNILRQALSILTSIDDFSEANIESGLRGLVDSLGLKAGQVFMPIRVAVSGRTATPGLFETLHVIGKDRVLSRMEKAIGVLLEKD